MELFKYYQNPSLLFEESQASVIIFQSEKYMPIFFMHIFDLLKRSNFSVKVIDIQSHENVWKSQLETSFLGFECLYWLGDVSILKTQQQHDIMKYIASYQGPHRLLLFCDNKIEFVKKHHMLVIKIQDKIFIDDSKKLLIKSKGKESFGFQIFLQQLYACKKSFSIDELCLLHKYQYLITSDNQEFYTTWIPRLIIPDTSLFLLSQLLFEKEASKFFILWLKMKPLYADMFWISFWSDQLYKSYFFIYFTNIGNYGALKQVSYGLSFVFMKQSYKQYQLDELIHFHTALYFVDTALKNGGHSYQIDQLFIDFFIGKFIN